MVKLSVKIAISSSLAAIATIASSAAHGHPPDVARAAAPLPKQSSPLSPHAWCWTTRDVEGASTRSYYFSRVWRMPSDEPTLGYQPQFQSFVSARYTARGGGSAQCVRFFGRQEAEMRMNNIVADARRNGSDVVFTEWWPRR